MRKQVLCAVILSGFTTLTAHAQNAVSGQVAVDYVPLSNYIRPEDSVKTGSKSDFRRIQFNLEVPLSTKIDSSGNIKRWSWKIGAAYAKMENRGYEEPLFPTEMLNAEMGLQYLTSLRKNWSLLTFVSVGIYSDLVKVNGKDILGQGGVLFIKKFRPNLAFGFGPVLSNSFGVPMILPGLYFDWKTNGKVKFNVNFPQGLSASYHVNELVDLRAVLNLDGMTAEREKNGKSMLSGFMLVTAGLQPQFNLGKNLKLQLTGGSTLARLYVENDRSLKSLFKNKTQEDPRFSPTFYTSVAFKWNMP
ncbi:hypothetical protein AAW12_00585 [Sphingobacterium sp. Ag1]|uniref:DUF6268 family outer membrane beta-barrel protein n=1 Tax=Sphingobacterium sp. Ag1 TaxID=1643451 RepID=UPI0006276C6D|nr:DUF6268 family outer membrane beta-barrel protein [Sphingobacterium sp. Ag1]KKO93281.1 hypothetical protein AAW12_00585 [Sphingobacterium sp. Ag1]